MFVYGERFFQHDMFQSPTALGGVPPRDPASHLTRRRHSTSL